MNRQDNITISDRYLGLVPTTELPELNKLIDKLVNLGENCFDWESLLPLLRKTEKADKEFSSSVIIPPISPSSTYPFHQ